MSLTSNLRHSLVLVVVLLAGACDAYDPQLGAKPWRCDPSAPTCPEGYGPVFYNPPIECLCEYGVEPGQPGVDAGVGAPDAGGVTGNCPSDPWAAGDPGANDTLDSAYVTTIGMGTSSAVVNDAVLCPVSDVDIYELNVTQAGKRIDARANYDAAEGDLVLHLLDATGSRVGTTDSLPNQLVAAHTTTVAGPFFVEVTATSGKSPYDLTILVSGP